MEAALAFAAEVGTAASNPERADGWIVEEIAHLVGADIVGYTEIDASHHILHDAKFPGPPTSPTAHEWGLLKAQNPFCHYAIKNGSRSFSAHRLTDVADMSAFRRTELFEVMGAGLPHDLQTWMPGSDGTYWALELARSGRNFSDRDVLLVDALRPSLMAYTRYRSLAESMDRLQAVDAEGRSSEALSVRENEVLDLVAGGATNAEIAERLWISPGTVRKHLEHIYVKLEVGSRTAALARTGRSTTR